MAHLAQWSERAYQ